MITKTKRIDLKASEADERNLRKAAENMKLETGKKPNVSSTIMRSIQVYANTEPFYFDKIRYKSCIRANEFAFNHYAEIVKAYQKLNIGDMTIEMLGDIEHGGENTIKEKYFNVVEANLDRLGVTNQALRDIQLQGCEAPFNEFLNVLNLRRNLLQRNRQSYSTTNIPIEVHHFSIVDGELQFSEADKAKIKECFEIRLNTQVKKDFVLLIDEFLVQYKKIKEFSVKNKFRGVWGPGNIFNINNDEIIFEKQVINQIKF